MIKVPEGYRLLEKGKRRKKGDLVHCRYSYGNVGLDFDLSNIQEWNGVAQFTGSIDDYFSLTIRKIDNPMNTNTLTITKEKILAGADKCPQAREVLKSMFPEVFEDDKSINVSLLDVGKAGSNSLIEPRAGEKYMGKAFCLREKQTKYGTVTWELVRDKVGYLCLVPTKK